MLHLLDISPDRFREWVTSQGLPAYRASQVRRWLFDKRAGDFAEMTDLPKPLRAAMAAAFQLWTTTVAAHRRSADGTEKLLLALADGQEIECVLIREGSRRTICISTQVGCAMGCVFCASGLDGVVRNLATGEIVEQMLRLGRLLPTDERLSNIVVMGMGEPLANLDRLLPALEMACASDGLGISPRRITISTVGLPAAMDRLANLDAAYHLAVSLHAPNDELRTRLVPVNRGTGIGPVLSAADRYFERSGRRLTFEYVLLGGVNDEPAHARQLARLLSGKTALLNVIPYNPVSGLPYRTPDAETRERFLSILRTAGINVQVRQRKGDAIDAACGQLRRTAVAAIPIGVSSQ